MSGEPRNDERRQFIVTLSLALSAGRQAGTSRCPCNLNDRETAVTVCLKGTRRFRVENTNCRYSKIYTSSPRVHHPMQLSIASSPRELRASFLPSVADASCRVPFGAAAPFHNNYYCGFEMVSRRFREARVRSIRRVYHASFSVVAEDRCFGLEGIACNFASRAQRVVSASGEKVKDQTNLREMSKAYLQKFVICICHDRILTD